MFRVTTGRAQLQKIGSQTSKSFGVSEVDIILYNPVRAQLAGVLLILGFVISWGGLQDICYNFPRIARHWAKKCHVHRAHMKQALSHGNAARSQ